MNKENDNDLISRKWLTDAIRNRRTYLSYEDAKDVIDLIDNAPTVKPQIEYGTDGQSYRLYMSGGQVVPDMLQGWRYEERPQGEFTLNDLKGYLLFYGYSSDAVEDTLINFESYVKGKKGGAENEK